MNNTESWPHPSLRIVHLWACIDSLLLTRLCALFIFHYFSSGGTFYIPVSHPEYHITFTYHISLDSFWLSVIQTFLVFNELDSSEEYWSDICRMSLKWDFWLAFYFQIPVDYKKEYLIPRLICMVIQQDTKPNFSSSSEVFYIPVQLATQDSQYSSSRLL